MLVKVFSRMRQETRSRFSARLHKSTATAPPRDRPKTKILLVSTSGRDLKGIAPIHTFPVSQNMAKFKMLCGKEVGAVEERLLQLDARVGLPPPGQRFEDCGSVWDGLGMVENNVQEIKLAIDDARFKNDAAVDALDERLTQTFRDEKATSERVFNTAIVETQAAIKEIAEVVHILAQEQERLTTNALQSSSSATVDSRALAELNALKVQIKLMEARMPSVLAGRLGGQLFQSRTDVLLFVENHVPSNSFFLFHDVVTLMESLMTSHVERRDVLQEWYQSAKVGVNEASA